MSDGAPGKSVNIAHRFDAYLSLSVTRLCSAAEAGLWADQTARLSSRLKNLLCASVPSVEQTAEKLKGEVCRRLKRLAGMTKMKGLDAALKVRTSRTIRSIELFSSL